MTRPQLDQIKNCRHALPVSTTTSTDFATSLREVALRTTRPRLAVLSAVHEHPHADTDTLIRAVREDLADVSHQSVYV